MTTTSYQTIGILHFNGSPISLRTAVVRRHNEIIAISTSDDVAATIARSYADKTNGITCKWECTDQVIVELENSKRLANWDNSGKAEKIGDTLRTISRVLMAPVAA